jgi:NAD-dependent deacetylase
MIISRNAAISTEIKNKLANAKRVAIITGAGISAESGIPTFRTAHEPNSLWSKYNPEDLATMKAFKKDPKLVWAWYNWRRELCSNAQPNKAHNLLVELEQSLAKQNKTFTLITQNVDNLHLRAGSSKGVIKEMHGNLYKKKCLYNDSHVDNYPIEQSSELPTCSICGSLARPYIVWFGESLNRSMQSNAMIACSNADVNIIIGTSGVVYPVAGYGELTIEGGGYVININLEELEYDSYEMNGVNIVGKASERLSELLE